MYERRPLSVCSFADGSTVTAWGYVYRRDLGGARPILGGDYRRDRADRAGPLQWYLAYGSNLHSVRLLKRFGHEHVAFVETGFLAVSYTHLDVYKRQVRGAGRDAAAHRARLA